MSNAAKLKKKAVELEQKKQFDKALALYIQFLDESDGALDDADIPLYNRVGDLMLRTGSASDALNYYERAIDLYADRGFLNNAIALCNKVLRQSPGRASIYYKLGKISANKGFKSDAKKNFLEYADRMQKNGRIDEAFRALKEFADLCPDQDDIRLLLAEQLSKENRQDEAMEQLQKLHDRLDSEGRTAEARATADRMKSIDPEAVPRVSGAYRPQKSTDLIFLDTSYDQPGARTKGPTPAPAARSAPATPVAPPAGRQVSDPDLVVLTLADQPDVPLSPASNPAVSGALDEPNDVANAVEPDQTIEATIPLLDVGDVLETADQRAPTDAEPITPLDLDVDPAPAAAAPGDIGHFDLAVDESSEPAASTVAPEPIEESAYAGQPPLSIDYAGDLASDLVAPVEPDGGDLFDFRAPPRTETDLVAVDSAMSLDPDVAFPSLGLDDMSLPSADEVTSGASLAAALGGESAHNEALNPFDESSSHGADGMDDANPAVSLDGATLDDEAVGAAELDWPADDTSSTIASMQADASALAADIDDMVVTDASPSPFDTPASTDASDPVESDDVRSDVVEIAAAPETPSDVEVPAAEVGSIVDLLDVSADDLLSEPIDAAPAAEVSESLDELEITESVDEVEVSVEQLVVPDADATPAEPVEPTAEPGPEDRRAGWEIQREQAERLLESGDRAGGVHVLEEVAAELERIGDLERALTIVDELIRLSPDSIRHHQKRVELAFRLNHRSKLIDAYLELGDALFRSGEERKARAVYQRVLELAPEDRRARDSLDSVSSMSPPTGSGAIQAIAPSAPADARPTPSRATSETNAASQPAGNGTRAAGVASSSTSKKPSPLERNAATNGDFVDLGEWLRAGESPKSTRMVAEEKPPSGDEEADFQEMLKRFKQGIAENVDEEDYESHYDLGVAYKEMGLMDEAVAEFQKSLRAKTNRVRSYEALGQCFVDKEQYQVAASVLGRAVALGEGDDHHLVGVLYLLGRATEALSQNRDALDYYQRVFAVDIEFRDVADRISAIERKAT